MRLQYALLKNFGDMLNPWLWPRLIPDVFDENQDGPCLSGIGSWLTPSNIENVDDKIIVFGTGAGYESVEFSFGRQFPWKTYPVRADIQNRASMFKKMKMNFKFYCVRGPLTASLLGFKPEMAITDPAVLLRTIPLPVVESSKCISFMPHCRTAESTDFQTICRELSFEYIDPGASVEKVLYKIRRSRLLITEALHGAIIADAFRIPWVPVISSDRILRFKWEDYCRSVGLSYEPARIRPVFKASRILATRMKPMFYSRVPMLAKTLIRSRAWFGNLKNREEALNSLRNAGLRPPRLSSDENLSGAIERLESALEKLKKDIKSGCWP